MGLILEKTLSANDVGTTGTHQAGVLVPKQQKALDVFPVLDHRTLNPRELLHGFDEEGRPWALNFIYYNNGTFGGTRNEYRLTGIGPYLRSRNAGIGDVLQIEQRDDGAYRLSLVRHQHICEGDQSADQVVRLRLTGSWRLVTW